MSISLGMATSGSKNHARFGVHKQKTYGTMIDSLILIIHSNIANFEFSPHAKKGKNPNFQHWFWFEDVLSNRPTLVEFNNLILWNCDDIDSALNFDLVPFQSRVESAEVIYRPIHWRSWLFPKAVFFTRFWIFECENVFYELLCTCYVCVHLHCMHHFSRLYPSLNDVMEKTCQHLELLGQHHLL